MSELRRFNLVGNGYDCYQVNNEIDRLEYHIQELNEKIMMYQKQVETVNNQFTMIKKRYQLLVSELSMREKQADDVARLALKEANSMIEDAKNNADNIIQEAILEVQTYMDKIALYNKEATDSKKEVVDAVNNLLEKLDKYQQVELPQLFKED